VICRFCSNYGPTATLDAAKAVTGWQDLTTAEASDIGRRAINLLRAFNLRARLDIATEVPSKRYASTPVDGPAQGKGMAEHFITMRRAYWRELGWDPDSGYPLSTTLIALGLDDVAADLAALGGDVG